MNTVPIPAGADKMMAGFTPHLDRILVPVDFSSPSLAAIDAAIALLQGNPKGHVSLVHVVEPLPGSDLIDCPMPVDLSTLIENAKDILSKLQMTYERRVSIVTEVVIGSAVRETVEMAARGSFDLIVMSSHGRGGLGRILLGSVAEGVAHHSSCPILVLKPAKYLEYGPAYEPDRELFGNVLVGCNRGTESLNILRFFERIIGRGRPHVTLMHATPATHRAGIDGAMRWLGKDHDDLVGSNQHLESLRKNLLPLSEKWEVASVEGFPWNVLVDRALATSCDLIVIGASHYRGLASICGNVASKLIRLAPCSVLVVK